MMQLISVQSIKRTETPGALDLILTADIGRGNETLPFTYTPGDPFGLSPSVAAFLEANPSFPIGAYVPPEPIVLDPFDTITLRSLAKVVLLMSQGRVPPNPTRTKEEFISLEPARIR